ncbi:TPA: FAD-dependent oxidoreductase [Pseudomonas putida]|jgi:NADPH-dependent 2,4-dienoyl-CoA reductase/sulfur reductase-like enzyme|uniref:FAD/NAD(P)-dependent oxidoreductase n=1 Tax=Pseudomonas putida TaxID=303 RepID=UPI0023638260|nr:NAD(P)/FAD-dependent oxidoreductase [Pseudomonas putida]MDD2008325.1 NAD(P)/FAD-dependent oxidoreductase [Pseudomonas putida]HDS1775790.1 FAD-dependent oxidoreductase [Pseudomonas putida]
MASEIVDLVIVGAGPAGLAAAIEARQWGLSVTLLDEQAASGGQIYRAVDAASARKRAVLGEDYAAGAHLTKAFIDSGARHIAGAAVWNVGRDLKVNFLHNGVSKFVQARQIILASGAMERPFPIPGWTLPGVMGAGAAQILYKSAGALPSEPVVLAGCGPLLYLLASQYLQAGVELKAVIHTTQHNDYLRAASHLPAALRGWRDLRKGMRMLAQLRRSKVPVFGGAQALSIEGKDRAQAICFTHKGQPYRVEASLILLHQGVVPNSQLSWSLRAKHLWNDAQLCWVPETDDYGQIEDSGIYVAGDSRGIVGAKASASQGKLAALAVAGNLAHLREEDRVNRESALRQELQSLVHIRPFLDALYRPPVAQRVPLDDSVIVCRCEEVTAGQIRKYAELGCQGPNQTKAFGRCGMGACQGRLCGLTVTELIAQARGVSPDDIGYYRIRPPIKPITLGELAG